VVDGREIEGDLRGEPLVRAVYLTPFDSLGRDEAYGLHDRGRLGASEAEAERGADRRLAVDVRCPRGSKAFLGGHRFEDLVLGASSPMR
jgi:hypothetical protein